MSEIKEIKGKSQTDEDILLSIAAGNRHSIMPNLEFEYSDNDIHEDAFKLIKYSCQEICTTKEQSNKVLNLWTTFLEAMLGVQSRDESSVSDSGKGILVNGDTTLVKEDGLQVQPEKEGGKK